MSPREPEFDDPDDFFKDTRMSLGDHIEELRMALWRAIKGFFVAVILAFFVADRVMAFISAPVESQLMLFYNNRVANKKAVNAGRPAAALAAAALPTAPENTPAFCPPRAGAAAGAAAATPERADSSAPASIRVCTASALFSAAAHINAVCPRTLSRALGSAP